MGKNENATIWIESAKESGIDLSWMYETKEGLDEKLESLGLPHPKTHIISGDKIDSPEIEDMFATTSFFCRLVPKDGGIRPYRLKLTTAEEFRKFVSEYDLTKYKVHFVEKGDLTHTGAIIATEEAFGVPGRCVIELVEGDGPTLFHGKETPISAQIEFPSPGPRVIRYHDWQNPTEQERYLIWRALQLIGGPSHPFPGYYEFDVVGGHRILFRNYQGPRSGYAKLDGFR